MRQLIVIILTLLLMPVSVWAAASRSFDGSGDNVDFGNNADITTGDVSWCIWAKPTEDASQDFFWGKAASTASTSPGYIIWQQVTSDIMDCSTSDGTTQQLAQHGGDADGAWNHFCCVWNAVAESDNLYSYKNGVFANSDTAGTLGSLTNAVNLRSGEDGSSTGSAYGLASYGIAFNSILSNVIIIELMWFPEGCGGSVLTIPPLWGDSTEIDLGPNDLSGTVTNATTSTDGPPVMFGGGLPL